MDDGEAVRTPRKRARRRSTIPDSEHKRVEPYRKRRWRKTGSPERIAFFTCARPGRSLGSTQHVSDDIVHKWVKGLPGPHTAIISLLGRKPNGTSEFSFYTFCGKDDTPSEVRGKQL